MRLTLRQRVLILKVCSSQQGSLTEMELWDDIQAKVRLSEEEVKSVFKQIPGSNQTLVDLALYDAEPENDIVLEKQERRVIKEALPTYKMYEPGEPAHVRGLIKALEETLSSSA